MFLLSTLQEWLLRQVCASEAVEPVISNLVSVLLKGCQDSSPEARLLCGECLGELGAVDPGRLDLSRTHTNGDRNTFVVSKTSARLCMYAKHQVGLFTIGLDTNREDDFITLQVLCAATCICLL